MNLLHRVEARNALEEAASNVINDLFRINTLMLREYKSVGVVSTNSQISKLQKSIKLNLKYVKGLKRELEYFKLETLYFEDDILGKFDLVRNTEKDIIKNALTIEDCFKEIILDSGILLEKKLRDPNVITKVIIEREIVGYCYLSTTTTSTSTMAFTRPSPLLSSKRSTTTNTISSER